MKFVKVLIAAATIATTALVAPPLAAQIPFSLPIIGSAAADPAAGKLTIHGANFGTGVPRVMLNTTELVVETYASDEIVARLPIRQPENSRFTARISAQGCRGSC